MLVYPEKGLSLPIAAGRPDLAAAVKKAADVAAAGPLNKDRTTTPKAGNGDVRVVSAGKLPAVIVTT